MAELLRPYYNSSHRRRHPDPWMGDESDWVDIWYPHNICVSLQHFSFAYKNDMIMLLKLWTLACWAPKASD